MTVEIQAKPSKIEDQVKLPHYLKRHRSRNGETLKQHRDGSWRRTKVDRLLRRARAAASCAKATRSATTSCSRKLRGGLVHARETAKKIAARPIVEQEGELCFTLYNAAGDCVLTSTGIIIHVGTMGAAIKYMIENKWEENPGIAPGDIFSNNDCSSATCIPATSIRSSRSSGKAA